jgi:hypothetical protein
MARPRTEAHAMGNAYAYRSAWSQSGTSAARRPAWATARMPVATGLSPAMPSSRLPATSSHATRHQERRRALIRRPLRSVGAALAAGALKTATPGKSEGGPAPNRPALVQVRKPVSILVTSHRVTMRHAIHAGMKTTHTARPHATSANPLTRAGPPRRAPPLARVVREPARPLCSPRYWAGRSQ